MNKIEITDSFKTNSFSRLCFVGFHSGPFAKDINTKKLFRLEFVSYKWVIRVGQQRFYLGAIRNLLAIPKFNPRYNEE